MATFLLDASAAHGTGGAGRPIPVGPDCAEALAPQLDDTHTDLDGYEAYLRTQ